MDEIEQAALIPTGVHRGRIVFWTRCQIPANRHNLDPARDCSVDSDHPYRSHILDPASLTVVESPWFQPAYGLLVPGTPPGPSQELIDGPGCSGFTWMLDAAGDPKLLIVGGRRFDQSPHKGSRETLWFDPNSNTVLPPPQPSETQYWFDGPGILPQLNGDYGAWYPSVVTFFDPNDQGNPPDPRYLPMVVGGARIPVGTGGDLYQDWWRMTDLDSLAWAVNDPGGNHTYTWHYYPRLLVLHTSDGRGEVVSVGSKWAYDEGANPKPFQKIHTDSVPHTHETPANQPSDVRHWNHSNVVLLHTLKDNWVFPSDPSDTSLALSQYDLNRVIGLMGTTDNNQGLFPPTPPDEGLVAVRELVGGVWLPKTDALRGRTFSNSVVLPDGTILVVGGSKRNAPGGYGLEDVGYYDMADLFDPQGPPQVGAPNGIWKQLASQIPDPTRAAPRAHHSVALLVPDGSVLVMGGQQDFKSSFMGELPNPEDTVEVFKPPYFQVAGPRPYHKYVPGTWHYGQTFTVWAKAQQGSSIVRFCLIGVSAVTHHYNYGQRYVELLYRSAPSPPPPFPAVTHEILAPPVPDLAPEGYYLFFAVDSQGKPSLGKFVKLTF